MNEKIILHGKWTINAPVADVFKMATDFKKFPAHFPKVAHSIKIKKQKGNYLEMVAIAKSFGQKFPVEMKTHIIPGKGFISDNKSPKFGTSGHEEFLLSKSPKGTVINYTYQVTIHKRWLRLIAKPLIGWYSMKYWQKAVIDELRKKLEL